MKRNLKFIAFISNYEHGKMEILCTASQRFPISFTDMKYIQNLSQHARVRNSALKYNLICKTMHRLYFDLSPSPAYKTNVFN